MQNTEFLRKIRGLTCVGNIIIHVHKSLHGHNEQKKERKRQNKTSKPYKMQKCGIISENKRQIYNEIWHTEVLLCHSKTGETELFCRAKYRGQGRQNMYGGNQAFLHKFSIVGLSCSGQTNHNLVFQFKMWGERLIMTASVHPTPTVLK